MGQVWKARHAESGTEVAIKFLNDEYAHNADLQNRFLNEGKRQEELNHPNIVRALDFVSKGGRNFLVMQFIPGGGLDQRIAQGPLPLGDALEISRQVLAALNYAHMEGVIHRDVKPSNIILGRNGQCYLTDFGIALAVGQERLTRAGTAMGTAHYMSPEQIRSPTSVDQRADVYSFGVVLYEMLTGVPPFDAEVEFLIHEAHVREAPRPPSQRNPGIPKAIEDVVLQALAKKPDDRFGGCGEMGVALELAAYPRPAGQTIPAPTQEETPRFPRSTPRRDRQEAVEDVLPDPGPVRRWHRYGLYVAALIVVLAYGLWRLWPDFVGQSITKRTPAPSLTRPAPDKPPDEPVRPPPPKKEKFPETISPPLSPPSMPKPGGYDPSSAGRIPPPSPAPAVKPSPVRPDVSPSTGTSPADSTGGVAPHPTRREDGANTPPPPPQPPDQKADANPPPSPASNQPADRPETIVDRREPYVKPPSPQVPTPPGPASGILRWSVKLSKDQIVTLPDLGADLSGDALPGVFVSVDFEPRGVVGVYEMPSPANQFRTLKLRGLVNRHISLTIRWTRQE
jgi:serine/threonine-protein kinase